MRESIPAASIPPRANPQAYLGLLKKLFKSCIKFPGLPGGGMLAVGIDWHITSLEPFRHSKFKKSQTSENILRVISKVFQDFSKISKKLPKIVQVVFHKWRTRKETMGPSACKRGL